MCVRVVYKVLTSETDSHRCVQFLFYLFQYFREYLQEEIRSIKAMIVLKIEGNNINYIFIYERKTKKVVKFKKIECTSSIRTVK